MERHQELLDALKAAEAAVHGTGDPADPARLRAQAEALARLEACWAAGLDGLAPEERAQAEARIRAALGANGLNLKWTRLRARLARIGVRREAPAGPRAPRLDIVS